MCTKNSGESCFGLGEPVLKGRYARASRNRDVSPSVLETLEVSVPCPELGADVRCGFSAKYRVGRPKMLGFGTFIPGDKMSLVKLVVLLSFDVSKFC